MQNGPNQSAAPGVLEALAALVHAVRFEELPKPVIAAAKVRVLDTLGCAFGALHSDVAAAVRRMAADCGGALCSLSDAAGRDVHAFRHRGGSADARGHQ